MSAAVVSLPRRGEGGVRGFGSFRIELHRPNPLNLSFSPLGRRDAACTQQFHLTARTTPHSRQMLTRSRAILG